MKAMASAATSLGAKPAEPCDEGSEGDWEKGPYFVGLGPQNKPGYQAMRKRNGVYPPVSENAAPQYHINIQVTGDVSAPLHLFGNRQGTSTDM
jgi:hypothetical protein